MSIPIVNVIKDSFQEYQNEHSLVLFCYGCNYACVGCYNRPHISNEHNIGGKAKYYLWKYLTPMHTAVVFLGGEVTIHGEELLEDMRDVKQKGLKVKVFTNASDPDLIDQMCKENIVDMFSIDLKCLENCAAILGIPMDDNEYLDMIKKSIRTIEEYNIPYEIRTTRWESVKSQVDEIRKYVANNFPKATQHIVAEDFIHRGRCK